MILTHIIICVGQNKYTLGKMFQVILPMAAIATNPKATITRTITHADHRKLFVGEILLLVEYTDLGKSGVWLWLHHDRVIWQVMDKEIFKTHWKIL